MASKSIRVMVVTPERMIVDEQAASVRVPMVDGSLGMLPGRAPLVGRLGFGELIIRTPAGTEQRYFLEEGFAEVRNDELTILTPRATRSEEVNAEQEQPAHKLALTLPGRSELEQQSRSKAVERARKSLSAARN